MKSKAARLAVGCAAALACIAGLVDTPSSQAGPKEAHLEAHGKVVWVLTRSDTGEVLSTREEHINVSAKDTCPLPDCGDRISATIFGLTREAQGDFSSPQGGLPGASRLALPFGIDLGFVDGGAPGTRPVGPENAAGVAPTTDYIAYFNLSPAFVLRAYFQTGGIQLIGG